MFSKNQTTATATNNLSSSFGDYKIDELTTALNDLNVKSITVTRETICFGLRSATPTVTLPRASIERSTIEEIREELRDALTRIAKQAEPMSDWLEEDASNEEVD